MKSPQTLKEEIDRSHENGKWHKHQAASWASILNHIFATTSSPPGWFERVAVVEEGKIGHCVLLKYREDKKSKWVVFRAIWCCMQGRKITSALISDPELFVIWCTIRGKGTSSLEGF